MPSKRLSEGKPRLSEGKSEAVSVYGRFRPAAKGMPEGAIEMLSERKVQVKEYEFTLDGVFEQITTQQQVYDMSAQKNVSTVVDGLNATLMAYGQTGAGKTHAMFGPDEVISNFSESDPALHGVIPRAIRQLFEALEALAPQDSAKYGVQCSFIELYLSHVNDLLGGEQREHDGRTVAPDRHLREGKAGVFVEHLCKRPLSSVEEAIEAIKEGSKLRMVAEMNMNKRSSRGHSIFTVYVQRTRGQTGYSGKLNLVDLAGMESAGGQPIGVSSNADRKNETRHINQSLTFLATVVARLCKPGDHVPWRDSSLTRLLQDSLGGNTKSTILVCLRTEEESLSETIASLRFAVSARGISTIVRQVGSSIGDKRRLESELANTLGKLEAAELEKRQLREQLEQLLRGGGSGGMRAGSKYRVGAAGEGGKPGNPGTLQGLSGEAGSALEVQTTLLREMKLSRTCITPDDLHDVMRGALAEAIGLVADADEAKGILAAAITSLNQLNPADLKATFPADARAWTGPAGYLQPVHGAWLTDWKEAAKFEPKMKELDALLRARITPTDAPGGIDVFISHDWGRPADGCSLSNSERAAKLKAWLEAKGGWKVVSSARVESGAEPSRQSAPGIEAKGGKAKGGKAKGDKAKGDKADGGKADGGDAKGGDAKGGGPHNEPGHWDFMISYTQRSDKASLMATKLYHELKGAGHSCWLDVYMSQKSEAAMQEAVEGSKVVIAIITGAQITEAGPDPASAYLARPFCLKELRWARDCPTTTLQPVVLMEDKTKISSFIASAPEDLADSIGGIDFVDINLSDAEYFQTGLNKIRRQADVLPEAEKLAAALERQQEEVQRTLQRTQLVLVCLTKAYMDAIASSSKGSTKGEWVKLRMSSAADGKIVPIALEKFTRELLGDMRSNHESMKAKVKQAVESALMSAGKTEHERTKAAEFCEIKFGELKKRTEDEAEAALQFDEDLDQAPQSVRDAYGGAQQQVCDLQEEINGLEAANESLSSQLQTALSKQRSSVCVLL